MTQEIFEEELMDSGKESLMMLVASVVVAVIALAIAPMTLIHWGISIDTLFLATVCLTIAAVLLINPAIAVLDGSLKEMMKQPESKPAEKVPAQTTLPADK